MLPIAHCCIYPDTLSLFCHHFSHQYLTADVGHSCHIQQIHCIVHIRCVTCFTHFAECLSDCLLLVVEMEARVWGRWSASIRTPTSGACVLPWPRGEEAWGWQRATTSYMPWADTTPPLPTTARGSRTVLRGSNMVWFFEEDTQTRTWCANDLSVWLRDGGDGPLLPSSSSPPSSCILRHVCVTLQDSPLKRS